MGGSDGCDTGTWEADLGCRCKLINQVRISCSLALCKDLDQMILVMVIQVMDAIRIIPENTEIRSSRFQSCKAAYCFVRIGIPLWIGILRYTPDTLNRSIISYQLFYHIHIRTFRSHRNIDHLNAEILGNTKVTVISRNRAKEFYLIQLAPWGISHDTMCHGS